MSNPIKSCTLTAQAAVCESLDQLTCSSTAARVDAILDILNANRRLEKTSGPDWVQREVWSQRLTTLIDAGQPIELVMPGFPCKSPNNVTKVFGDLPDAAEKLAVHNLTALAGAINSISPGGARVVIITDGYVFGDLVRVKDQTINRYLAALDAMIPDRNLFKIVTLHDLLPNNPCAVTCRNALMETYAPEEQALRTRIEKDAATNGKYTGMKRFLIEDSATTLLTEQPGLSKNAITRMCGETALHMMLRDEAFQTAIRHAFPNCIRCSVHPQPDSATEKIGIALINREDGWGTPWHGTLRYSSESPPKIIKRREGEQDGLHTVYTVADRRPWIFLAPDHNGPCHPDLEPARSIAEDKRST